MLFLAEGNHRVVNKAEGNQESRIHHFLFTL